MGRSARVTFVAGLDAYMTSWLGRLHSRYATPYAALIVQGLVSLVLFLFQAEDGIRVPLVTGVQTCALPICGAAYTASSRARAIRTVGDAVLDTRVAQSRRPRSEQRTDDCALAGIRSRAPRSRPGIQIGRASCRERG